jgi:hypothetical protein
VFWSKGYDGVTIDDLRFLRKAELPPLR